MSEKRGRIFDIQRFSLHDGAGIRTCVFFKGCPLRCDWCQNPEGIAAQRELTWLGNRCIGCGTCAKYARSGGAALENGRLKIRREADEDWEWLIDACPAGALRWAGQDVSVEEVMEAVRRDRPFYRHGGGGVTLTGGDPVMQAEFAAVLLQQCRAEGFHTAMETEAALPWTKFEPLLRDLDALYVDLKLVNADLAMRHTGTRSTVTLDNLQHLLTGSHKEKVTVRTPLIPGITATDKNLREASAFLAALSPDTPWELLNYNTLASAKYSLLGRQYPLPPELEAFSSEEMHGFAELARRGGMRRVYWDHGGSR